MSKYLKRRIDKMSKKKIDINVIVNGASGEMGKRLILAISDMEDVAVSDAIECKGHESIGKDAGVNAGCEDMQVKILTGLDNQYLEWNKADVVIDYTNSYALNDLAVACLAHKKPLVIGTIGISRGTIANILKLDEVVPVVFTHKNGTDILGAQALPPDCEQPCEKHKRTLFVHGAICAAAFAVNPKRRAGLYYGDDVLNSHEGFGIVYAQIMQTRECG